MRSSFPELGRSEFHRQREESLLCTVVEVTLDPSPLGALGFGETPARALDVGEAAGDLGAEASVVQLGGRDPGAGTNHLGVGSCGS